MVGGGREGLGAGVLAFETTNEILSLLTDKWTLVALVVDEARASLYLNATLAVSRPLPPGEFVASSARAEPELLIGRPHPRKGTPNYLQADLDEVAIFAKPLTQMELIQHYLATTFDTNHVRPHINCKRSTTGASTATARQTHDNPVQSCEIADQGLKVSSSRPTQTQVSSSTHLYFTT